MSIDATAEFVRLAKRAGVHPDQPIAAVQSAEQESIDASRGSGLIKQRVAKPGRGRSGCVRTIVYLRFGRFALTRTSSKEIGRQILRHMSWRRSEPLPKSWSTSVQARSIYWSLRENGDRSMRQRRKDYRSDALRSVHSAIADLHDLGLVDKTTMREFDLSCLTVVKALTPEEIRSIRDRAHMSQATFALALNVTTSLVSQWERGEKRPSGPSLKLLALADRKGIDAIL